MQTGSGMFNKSFEREVEKAKPPEPLQCEADDKDYHGSLCPVQLRSCP